MLRGQLLLKGHVEVHRRAYDVAGRPWSGRRTSSSRSQESPRTHQLPRADNPHNRHHDSIVRHRCRWVFGAGRSATAAQIRLLPPVFSQVMECEISRTVCTRTRTHTRGYARTHPRAHARIHTNIHTYVRVHAHTYICAHTHTHTHTHTHAHTEGMAKLNIIGLANLKAAGWTRR